MEFKNRQEKITYLKNLLNNTDNEMRVFITERGSNEVTMICNGNTTTISRSEFEVHRSKSRGMAHIDFNLAK